MIHNLLMRVMAWLYPARLPKSTNQRMKDVIAPGEFRPPRLLIKTLLLPALLALTLLHANAAAGPRPDDLQPVVSDPLLPDTEVPPVAPYGGLDGTGNISGDWVYYPSDLHRDPAPYTAITPEPRYAWVVLVLGLIVILSRQKGAAE